LRWPFRRREGADKPGDAGARRLGLALGGGAVRGAAHLGVLAVLEREGVRPDVISGTSVGALVGAGIAGGLSAAEMLEYFTAARWRDLARPSWRSKLSMLDGDPLGRLLERVVAVSTIEELKLPFAAVASDILTATTFVFESGPLREALVASSAIPGIFEPVRHDGMLLVDGGLTDNLPVDAALELGADFVVAVDIMLPMDGTYEPRDIRDMLMMSLNIVEGAGRSAERADILIRPDVAHVSFSDFSHVQAAYDAGVEAAEGAVGRILDAMGGASVGA
jgi:NTE family protein